MGVWPQTEEPAHRQRLVGSAPVTLEMGSELVEKRRSLRGGQGHALAAHVHVPQAESGQEGVEGEQEQTRVLVEKPATCSKEP